MVWCESHIRTPQTVCHQFQHIVVVRQTTGGRRHSEISILWQDHVLGPYAHLKVLVVVGHPIVEENSQGVLEVLDLGPHLKIWCFADILEDGTHRERFIPEVSQATCQLLGGTIVLKID